MKKSKLIKLMSIVLAVFSTTVLAADIQVEWTNPDDYRDVRAANESKKRFQERTFEKLDKHFTELASKLPEGYQLVVKVTDVDLAGNVEFGRTQQIRIVRQIHFPRMDLEYQLFDDKKQLISTDKAELKDMSFLNNIKTRAGSQTLSYEKYMIEEWFNKTFSQYMG